VNLSSTVMIFPLVRIRSAEGCCAVTNTAPPIANTNAAAAIQIRLH
jgi:hypothetical protein